MSHDEGLSKTFKERLEAREKQSDQLSELPKVTDGPDFNIDAAYIAKHLGIGAVSPKMRGIPRPSKSGVYPFVQTVEAMFRYLRREKEEISREELAELCDCSGQRINAMVKEGIVHAVERGRFDRVLSLKGIFKWMRGRIGQGETTQAKARTSKTELENKLLEIQVKRAEGDNLDRRAVEKAWEDRLLVVRQQLLALPGQFADRVAYFKNAAEVQAELTKLIEHILQNAARPIDYELESADSQCN